MGKEDIFVKSFFELIILSLYTICEVNKYVILFTQAVQPQGQPGSGQQQRRNSQQGGSATRKRCFFMEICRTDKQISNM